MKTAIFLGEIGKSGDLYQVECLRVGHWDYPGMDAGFEITPAVLTEMAANFNAGTKGRELPLNREHEDERPCGWVKAVQLAPDKQSLYALFEVTDPTTKQLVDDRSLKYCSSEIDLAWFDPENKQTCKVLEGLALTNRPYIKRMDPITPLNLSEMATAHPEDFPGDRERGGKPHNQQEENMDPKLAEKDDEIARLKAKLKEVETSGGSPAKLAELEAKLADEKKERDAQALHLAELQKNQRETAGKLRMTEIKTRLAKLLRAGKPISVPLYKKVLSLSEALISTGTTVIQLGEKKKLDESDDDGTDKLDVIDSVLDILDNLPDSISTDPDATAVLDEDAPALDNDDDDKKLDSGAKAAMKENPKLTYRQAVVLADRKARGVR